MSPPADQLRDYLAPEEPLVAVSTGTLSAASSWKPVSIGLTDRRLLCVSEDGRFMTIGYDAICTIRSRPRTTCTYRGIDHRLLLGSGSLGVLLGGIGVLILAMSVFVPLLALITVGGLIVAEYVRRNADEIEWGTVAEGTKHVPYEFDGTSIRQWYERVIPDVADDHQVLLIGSGVVAMVSFVDLVLLASSGLVVLGVLGLVGGIALIDYADRHADDFDGMELAQRHEMEVSISTDADRTIHIRSDPSAEIVHELSRVAFMDDVEATQLVSPHS